MKEKEIVLHLALNRGSLSTEKIQILKKNFSGASPSFLRLSSLVYHVLLLVYIYSDCSLARIYEHTNINSSIVLRILVKFNLLVCDKSKATHRYNITPLTRLIIADLLAAYKANLNTFHALNMADKKADYLQIKAKIKDLKQK